MALAEIGARLRLQGASAFRRDAERGADSVDRLGREADRTERRLRGLSSGASRAGRAIGGIARGGALGGLAAVAVGVTGLSAALYQGFKDAAALQTTMAKTNAVIASTGGVANVSARGVVDLADELESLSGMDGDAIINAQNLLLTFTQVRNGVGKTEKVFDQATRAAVDMAAALGQDPAAAAMQLGKALNSPIKGVSALGKAGVSFSDDQKRMIKRLVETNRVMDAQKIILGEMEVQFGGAAKAAGSGFEGSILRAKDAVGDLFRDLATPLLPVVTKQIERFSTYLNDKGGPAIQGFAQGFVDGTGAGGRFRDRLDEMRVNTERFFREGAAALRTFVSGSLGLLSDAANTLAGMLDAVAKFSPVYREQLRGAAQDLRGVSAQVDAMGLAVDRFYKPRNLDVHVRLRGAEAVRDLLSASASGKASAASSGAQPSSLGQFLDLQAGISSRYAGGMMQPGRPYIVGEHRPEVVVPQVASRVIPRTTSGAGAAAAGGGPIHITVVSELDGRVVARNQITHLQDMQARR